MVRKTMWARCCLGVLSGLVIFALEEGLKSTPVAYGGDGGEWIYSAGGYGNEDNPPDTRTAYSKSARYLATAYSPTDSGSLPVSPDGQPIESCSESFFKGLGYGGEALGELWKTCDSVSRPSYCGLAGDTCQDQTICRDWSIGLDVTTPSPSACPVVVGFSRWHTADGTNPPFNPEFRHGIRWSYNAGLLSYVPEVLSNKIGNPIETELHVIPRWVSQSGELVVGQVLSRRPSPFDGSRVQQRGFHWKEGATCPADPDYQICRIVDLEGPVAGYPWGPVGSHCQATAGSLTARYKEGDPNLPSSYDILGYGTNGQGNPSMTSNEPNDPYKFVKRGIGVCLPASTQGDPQSFYTSFQGESSPALSVSFTGEYKNEANAISANGYAVINKFDINNLPVSVSIYDRSGGSAPSVTLVKPSSYTHISGETISPDGNYVGGYGATFSGTALQSLVGLVWNRSTSAILHQLRGYWDGCGSACKGAWIRDLSNNGTIGVGSVWMDQSYTSLCEPSVLGYGQYGLGLPLYKIQAMIWLKPSPSDPDQSGTIVPLSKYLEDSGMNEPAQGDSITGWEFCEATAISDDGYTITGIGIHNRAGIGPRPEAFVVRLAPVVDPSISFGPPQPLTNVKRNVVKLRQLEGPRSTMDIVTADTASLQALINSPGAVGPGTPLAFSPAPQLTGLNGIFFDVGDMDGDGVMDLVTNSNVLLNSAYYRLLTVFKGLGIGIWNKSNSRYYTDSSKRGIDQSILLPFTPTSASNSLDIVGASLQRNNFYLMENKGTGDLSLGLGTGGRWRSRKLCAACDLAPPFLFQGYGMGLIAAADLDGVLDQKHFSDFVILNELSMDQYYNAPRHWRGIFFNFHMDNLSCLTYGTCTYKWKRTGDYAQYLALGDFNRDHRIDIVSASDRSLFIHIASQPSGVPAKAENFDYSQYSHIALDSTVQGAITALATGDLNADGFSDIVVGTSSSANAIVVYLAKGDGTFITPARTTTLPSGVLSLAVGKLDADSCDDIVAGAMQSYSLNILRPIHAVRCPGAICGDGRCSAQGGETTSSCAKDCLAAYELTCNEEENIESGAMHGSSIYADRLFDESDHLICGASRVTTRTLGESLHEWAKLALENDPVGERCFLRETDWGRQVQVPCG